MSEISRIPVYLVTAPEVGGIATEPAVTLSEDTANFARAAGRTLRIDHGLGNGALVLASLHTAEFGRTIASELDCQWGIGAAIERVECQPLVENLDAALDEEVGGYELEAIVIAARPDLVRAARGLESPRVPWNNRGLPVGGIHTYRKGSWASPFDHRNTVVRSANGNGARRTRGQVVAIQRARILAALQNSGADIRHVELAKVL